MSAASESTMRLMSGSVTENWELSAIKGCDLSTRATYLRVYTVHTITPIQEYEHVDFFPIVFTQFQLIKISNTKRM